MLKYKIIFYLIILNLIFSFQNLGAGTGRIYGKVKTTNNETFEGWIRWDKHETFWDDYLDATKKYFIESDWDEKILLKVYGPYKIYRDEKDFRTNSQVALQFGHISKIIKKSSSSALIELKDGRQLFVNSAGGDIGSGNRGIEVCDLDFGKISIDWNNFESVEFMEEKSKYRKQKNTNDVYRLYGLVKTRGEDEFKGFIMWDNDECLSTDILNGKYRGRDMEIPFANIFIIRRDSPTTSLVEMKNGTRFTLSASNDVGQGHRGIVVKDPEYGEIHIPWNDFEAIEFFERETKYLLDYNDFTGGKPLFGEVLTRDRQIFKGYICWDNDETFTSDVLDGKLKSFDANLEFGSIYSIEYHSRRAAIIELWNGNRFELSGSNDVDDRNMGIYIMKKNGAFQKLDWEAFQKVIFSR